MKAAFDLGVKLAIIDLGPGEFTLGDKLQPYSYISSRANALKKVHAVDPALASELISLVYPHPASRPWTDTEIRERLGIPEVQKTAAYELAYKYTPSLASAYDAFTASRNFQAQQQAELDAMRYPALNSTQPARMLQQASYSMDPTSTGSFDSPPVHHRRHRHRHST